MGNEKEILIVGAGVSGLTVAHKLPPHTDYVILERENIPGGLATQFKSGDYWFDYGGHYFHFQDKPHIKTFLENFTGFDSYIRKSKTFLLGRYIPFPIQFHLSRLPAAERRQIYRQMRECLTGESKQIESLQDFLLAHFGERLTHLFFEPFLSKYYNSPTHALSANMDKGSIPVPDLRRVEEGYVGKIFGTAGYNATILYPRPSLRAFIENYAAPVEKHIHFNQEVIEIDILNKRVVTTGGQYRYRQLITTMPLNRLMSVITPKTGFPSPEEFIHTSTLLVNAVLKNKRKRFHWVYLAEKKFPFYRAGLYAGRSPAVCYLERNLPPEGSFSLNRDGIVNEVAFTLKELQVIGDSSEIQFLDARIIPVSYVVFHRRWHSLVPPVLEKLKTYDIHSIGRYGLWNYSSMANDIKDAMDFTSTLKLV